MKTDFSSTNSRGATILFLLLIGGCGFFVFKYYKLKQVHDFHTLQTSELIDKINKLEEVKTSITSEKYTCNQQKESLTSKLNEVNNEHEKYKAGITEKLAACDKVAKESEELKKRADDFQAKLNQENAKLQQLQANPNCETAIKNEKLAVAERLKAAFPDGEDKIKVALQL